MGVFFHFSLASRALNEILLRLCITWECLLVHDFKMFHIATLISIEVFAVLTSHIESQVSVTAVGSVMSLLKIAPVVRGLHFGHLKEERSSGLYLRTENYLLQPRTTGNMILLCIFNRRSILRYL